MNSKVNLDFGLVDKARQYAREIAADTQRFIEKHTSVTIERTCARLLGIDGIDDNSVPLPNVIVDSLKAANGLSLGLSVYLGNAIIQTGKTPQEIAERIAYVFKHLQSRSLSIASAADQCLQVSDVLSIINKRQV